ncbi:MAG: hypothetical protein ACI9T9_002610 [Oleiphilaceae bacterium]|jgi:hypothetical protein
MAQGEYELAFYGKIAEGASLDKVKENIAQLFKANGEQVARMFTGNRVVIRNKLDEETALKYIVAMKKRGAICQIERMGKAGVEVNFSAPASTPSAKFPDNSLPEKASVPVSNTPTNANIRAESNSPTETKSAPVPHVEASSATPKKVEMANPNSLPIAGVKVDEILSNTHLELGATGTRLSEEHEEFFPEHHRLDDVTLAPTGSVLTDKKEQIPVAVPDISHLSIKPN